MNMELIAGILAAIVAIDHVLAAIPSLKSNSTFQLISSFVLNLAGVFPQQPPKS